MEQNLEKIIEKNNSPKKNVDKLLSDTIDFYQNNKRYIDKPDITNQIADNIINLEYNLFQYDLELSIDARNIINEITNHYMDDLNKETKINKNDPINKEYSQLLNNSIQF